MALLISGLMNFLKLPFAKVRSFYLNINTRSVMHEVLGQMNKQEYSGLLNPQSCSNDNAAQARIFEENMTYIPVNFETFPLLQVGIRLSFARCSLSSINWHVGCLLKQ